MHINAMNMKVYYCALFTPQSKPYPHNCFTATVAHPVFQQRCVDGPRLLALVQHIQHFFARGVILDSRSLHLERLSVSPVQPIEADIRLPLLDHPSATESAPPHHPACLVHPFAVVACGVLSMEPANTGYVLIAGLYEINLKCISII